MYLSIPFFPTPSSLDTRRLKSRIQSVLVVPERWGGSGIHLKELSTTYVRYRMAGQGKKTLVLALDPPNVVEQCDKIIALMKDEYRVIIFEQPGFGFSFPKTGFVFSIDAYAAFLEEFLDTLNARSSTLGFPCCSVYFGMKVAEKRPDLVARALFMQAADWRDQKRWAAIVADVFTFFNLKIPFGGRYLMKMPYLAQFLGSVIEKNFPKRTQPFVVYQGRKNRELTRSFVEPEQRAHDNGACSCMPTFYATFLQEQRFSVAPLRQKVTLAWAVNDGSHFFSNKKGLMKYFTAARYVEVEGCAHHFDLERPEILASLIRELEQR